MTKEPDIGGIWDNRIISKEIDGETLYGIFETFYDSKGKPIACTVEPETGWHESVENLIKSLEYLYKDAKRCKKKILEYDKIGNG